MTTFRYATLVSVTLLFLAGCGQSPYPQTASVIATTKSNSTNLPMPSIPNAPVVPPVQPTWVPIFPTPVIPSPSPSPTWVAPLPPPAPSLPKIICRAHGPVSAQGSNLVAFSADQCTGNVLPDRHYMAVLTKFYVNYGTSGEFIAYQPINGHAAAVWFYAKATTSQNAQYGFEVTYLPPDPSNLIYCSSSGAIPQVGSNLINFSPSQCNGSQLPGPDYIAIPVAIMANGGTSGEFSIGQPVNGQAPSAWFYSLAPAHQGNYLVQVAYLKKPCSSPITTCSASGAVGSAGSHTISYSSCNGPAPDSNAIVVPTSLYSNYGTSGEFDFSLSSVWWWALKGGGNYGIRATFFDWQ